jgi:hypothetical protein
MIHVALVSAYPDEVSARAAFEPPPTNEYRGVWKAPEPYNGLVHLFSDEEPAELVAVGWEPQK